jgi:hypothetical protein
MSTETPFAEEQAANADPSFRSTWNPWGAAEKPNWYSGFGYTEDTAYLGPSYRLAAMAGSSVAKGELLLSGGMRAGGNVDLGVDESGGLVGTQAADQRQEAADAIERDAKMRLRALRPDPTTTGVALQTLHGLGEMASTIALTSPVGGPAASFAALSSTEGYSSYQDLIDQGMKAETAAKVAGVRGLFAGAGAVTPMVFGAGLATRLLTGAASNVGFGTVNRAIDSAILRDNGYTEMADQEQVFDRSQMLIDLAMGLGFGGVHHLLTPAGREALPKYAEAIQADSQMRDSALTAEIALKDRRSGPGVPVSPKDANAHTAALERAVNNLQDGEHVNVEGTGVEESTVLPRGGEENPALHDQIIDHVFSESGLGDALADRDEAQAMLERRLKGEPEPAKSPEAQATIADIARASDLPQEHRAIETRFAEQVGGDYKGAVKDYNELPDTEGGKIINTDAARELSADYRQDRSTSAAVHEPASWMMKRLFAEKLKQRPKTGERNMVLFTAGGTGAGKSTALKALGGLKDRAQIVYDTNMNSFDSALKKINQTLAAGKKAEIVYTYRDPLVALKEGALKRASRQEGESGTGRTVPIDEHLGTHIGSRDVIERLQQHFKGDERVHIYAADNRGETAKLAKLEELPKFGEKDYTQLREQATQILNEERAAGRISERTYRGFAGKGSDENVASGIQPGARPRAGGEPESQRQGERPDAVASDIASQAIADNPDLSIQTEDGNTLRASNAIATAAETLKRTEKDAPTMFKAAADCFMRQG